MGFEFVHLAEFAWFKMEPEEGKFDFTWLDKVLNLLHKVPCKSIAMYTFCNHPNMDAVKLPGDFCYGWPLYPCGEWYAGIRVNC
jgi:beta-galactosidase